MASEPPEGTIKVDEEDQEGAHAKFGQMIMKATLMHRHLWIAIVAYYVPVPSREQLILHPHDITGSPNLACYICEQEFEEGMQKQRCPGDPGPERTKKR